MASTTAAFVRGCLTSGAAAVLWLLAATFAHSQTPGATDPLFKPVFGAGGLVASVVLQRDGKVLAGGLFSDISGVSRQNLARLNADGTLDPDFPAIALDGQVNKLLLRPDGSIILFGAFKTVEGVARNGIARIDANGTLDPVFAANAPSNDGISSMGVQSDGKILVAGFTMLNGAAAPSIARLNSDGSLDTTFDVGPGEGYPVSLYIQADDKIVVAAPYLTIRGIARNSICRLNPDGSFDGTYEGSGFPSASFIFLLPQPDGKLIVYGYLNSEETLTMVRLEPDGTLDPGFDSVNGADDIIFAGALQSDGKILIAGDFKNVKGQPRQQIARLNADGSLDPTFDAGSGGVTGTPYIDLRQLTVQADGAILLGGRFLFVDGVSQSGLARLLPSGGSDGSFNARAGAQNPVYVLSLAIQQGGRVLVGGDFGSANGQSSGGFAALIPDGSLDTSFSSGTGVATLFGAGVYPDPSVDAIAAAADGGLYVVGYFRSFEEEPHEQIAHLYSNGSVDAAFSPSVTGFDNGLQDPLICTLAVQSDGKLVIGGSFQLVNGTGSVNIARMNPDGSLDAAFPSYPNVPLGTNPLINSLLIQPDGKILVGGGVTLTISGQQIEEGIARLNSDGTLDTAFSGQSEADNTVTALALQPDGRILVATQAASVSSVARLNADGTLDEGFNAALGEAGSTVQALALQPDGRVLAAGDFTTFDGFARMGLVRLNADGSVDTRFDSGSALADPPAALALLPNGEILAGGGATLVRLYGDSLRPAFFNGARNVNDDFFYLTFPSGAPFGFYSYDFFPYLYHADLGFEYFIDAQDGQSGAYLYDFASKGFFYTSPSFPFPFLYDFTLQSIVYYFPDAGNPGHYTSNPRYFFNFSTGQVIAK